MLLWIWNIRANRANEEPVTALFGRAVCGWVDGAGGNKDPKMVQRGLLGDLKMPWKRSEVVHTDTVMEISVPIFLSLTTRSKVMVAFHCVMKARKP